MTTLTKAWGALGETVQAVAVVWAVAAAVAAGQAAIEQKPVVAPAAAKQLTDVQQAQQSVLDLSQALVAKDDRIGQLEMEVGQLRRQLAKANAERLQPVVQKFVEDAAKTLGIAPEDYDPATRAARKK